MSIARILDRADAASQSYSAARAMPVVERRLVAKQAIGGASITDIATTRGVSRKFVYEQKAKAEKAIDIAFDDKRKSDDEVLFHVPVTKALLRQIILALLLRCHSSFRGAILFLSDVFGLTISIGTIHNVVAGAIQVARRVNADVTLEKVDVGCHDEIYQAHKPVLVGVDSASTYCYLLEAAEHCDEDTWGYHLLKAGEAGLALRYVVADQGKAQRAGLRVAFPQVPCYADCFHLLRDVGQVARYYDNRLKSAVTERERLENKMLKILVKGEKKASTLSRVVGLARIKEQDLRQLATDLATLFTWLKDDILAPAGMTHEDRLDLYDYVILQLTQLETGRGKVSALRKKLAGAKADVLGFVRVIEAKLDDAAIALDVARPVLADMTAMLGLALDDQKRYECEARLRAVLRHRFHDVMAAVQEIIATTPRASSIAENLNSILRGYFFLRRQVGGGYLDLLRFYLNHRVLRRSDRLERVGKTPRELLTGQAHEHWLTLLGFKRRQYAT